MSLKKDILVTARERLERGWIKGAFGPHHREDGAVCALGALYYGMSKCGIPLEDDGIRNTLRKTLESCVPDDSQYMADIITFNDWPDTRKEDVLQLFDCAIEKIEV